MQWANFHQFCEHMASVAPNIAYISRSNNIQIHYNKTVFDMSEQKKKKKPKWNLWSE